jgi:hypothetical protein
MPGAKCAYNARIAPPVARASAPIRLGTAPKNVELNCFSVFYRVMVYQHFCQPIILVSRTMSALEALHAIVTDEDSPQIIRDHIVDSLQFALRNQPGFFTTKEVQWLSQWDDTRIPIAATKILNEMKTN